MTFDPAKHLTKVSGKDYLEVKFRLVWLRDAHPEALIQTQLVEHKFGEYALFKATVSLKEALAEGHGSETPRDFGDYIEKAETKAIGRALAALGFGTQFTTDFDEDMTPGRERIADSPVAKPGLVDAVRNGDRGAASYGAQTRQDAPGGPPQQKTMTHFDQPITERQSSWINDLASEIGLPPSDLDKMAKEADPRGLPSLNRKQASDLITKLQGLRQAVK